VCPWELVQFSPPGRKENKLTREEKTDSENICNSSVENMKIWKAALHPN
jgi:hypothetical protein